MLRLVFSFATALVLLALAGPGRSATVVINNGLAPPFPSNVIDAANSFPADRVFVQNVGCNTTIEEPCPQPWGNPTTVELVPGGAVGEGLDARETSTVLMTGGSTLSITAREGSKVTMSGGSSESSIVSRDVSRVTVSGGSVEGNLVAITNSSIQLTGGSVTGYIGALGTSAITIVGSNFAVDGSPVGAGPIAATSGVLTGTLLSGQPMSNLFCHQGSEACGFSTTGLIVLIEAGTRVINNGLAPPNPENVIDASNSFPFDTVSVQNVGCDTRVEEPCPMPWGNPTSVELVAGGSANALNARQTSTVTILGGSVARAQALESSRLDMEGGSVAGDLAASASATLAMAGGSVGGRLAAISSANVRMSGGSVGGELVALDLSTLTIVGFGFAVNGVPVREGPILAPSGVLTGTLFSGGPIDNAFCHDGSTNCGFLTTGTITLVETGLEVINNGLAPPNPDNVIDAANSFPFNEVFVQNVGCDATVNTFCPRPWGDPTTVELVDGGSVVSLSATQTSIVAMRGGTVREDILTLDSSSVTMSAGLAGDSLEAYDSSTVTLSGGSVGDYLPAFDSSTVTITGGSVKNELAASDAASVTWSGGSIGSFVEARGSAAITIVGTDFEVDGVPVPEGPLLAQSGFLTGTLASGGSIDNEFRHNGATPLATGLITLIAEPDATPLIPAALLTLAALRRRGRRRRSSSIRLPRER